MLYLTRPLSLVALAGVALSLSLAPARAQDPSTFRSFPTQATPTAANTTTSVNIGPASYGNNNGSSFNCAPGGYPGYGGSPYGSAAAGYGAYLSGAADVFNAQGQYQIQRAQGRIMTEQWKQSQLETKRKTLDEWNYEREHTPTFQDIQERERWEALRRARNDPPYPEIWSGTALNVLLDQIQKRPPSAAPVPPVPVNPEILPSINVTSGASPGSLGLLRDGGKLQWPLTLKKAYCAADRATLDKLAPQAFKEAQSGQVNAEVLDGMTQAVQNMQQALDDNISQITPGDHTRAARYLREMSATIVTLQDPNVGKLATHKWAAKGNNVAQLVQDMTSQGLHFAPAVSGDEAAYVSLHRALVSYDMELMAGGR